MAVHTSSEPQPWTRPRQGREIGTLFAPVARSSSAWIRSYSRFVSVMKVLLPLLALTLVTLVVVWPQMRTDDARFRVGFSGLNDGGVEDPSMINARYYGVDQNRQPYSITADFARNLPQEQSQVELEMPKADLALDDGTWVVLTAESGVYDRDEETLDLVGAVDLFHDSGYEFQTSVASVDLNTGIATGTEPVRGQGPFGDLQAEGFHLEKKGQVIVFTGKARLVLYPGAGKQTP